MEVVPRDVGQVVRAYTWGHRVGLQVRHAAVGDAVQLGVTALLKTWETRAPVDYRVTVVKTVQSVE